MGSRSDSAEALKARAAACVDTERAALLELSGRIHAHPELCYSEHRAAGWLADYLESRGFAVERGAYGLATAFAARIGNGRPRVAVLCEYDALPGIGHACGHNVIAAAGAGAGVALGSIIADTGGSVVVLGTPAEEGGGGKICMAREGAFDEIDAAMMVHPASLELITMNVLAVSAIDVEYRGRAAHAAAAPHAGINALDGLVTAYQAIAQLRQHIRPTERVHGIITDGGQAPNIVPERAAGLFFVRAATEQRLAKLKERVDACFHAGALASGAEYHTRRVGEDYSDMWTNTPFAAAYQANLAQLGRHVVDVPAEQISGSTDMGNVSKLVPSIHPMISIAPPRVALHTQEFARCAASADGERGVVDGAKAMALTGIDVLCTPGLLDAMRAAFQADGSVAPFPVPAGRRQGGRRDA
jgi:amidohydrolase